MLTDLSTHNILTILGSMAGREAWLESFAHGSVVGLRLRGGGFISCETDPSDARETNLIMRGEDCKSWERFRLHQHPDNTCSLQQLNSTFFVSPISGETDIGWTMRNACPPGGWERLCFTPFDHDADDGLVKGWFVHVIVDNERRYLGVKGTTLVVRDEASASVWELLLAKIPTLMVAGVQLPNQFFWSQFDPRRMEPGEVHRGFVLGVLRALRTIGAFYVSGHGLTQDLFHICRLALDGLPYIDDRNDGTDDTRKVNHRLFSVRGQNFQTSTLSPDELRIDSVTFHTLIPRYFHDAEVLSNGLLHAVAAAQLFGGGDDKVSLYRSRWRDEWQYLGLRVLAYHPGPRTSGGRSIRTTSRHTDATWLTLLQNDEIDGLHIKSPTMGDLSISPPPPGALLVNTGNVMAKASQGFFSPVCHWVKRTERTETQTRISMPFFYDRSDDTRSCPSFWNGGTQGC